MVGGTSVVSAASAAARRHGPLVWQVAEQRLKLSEGTYGAEHPMTATCLNDVGTFVQVVGIGMHARVPRCLHAARVRVYVRMHMHVQVRVYGRTKSYLHIYECGRLSSDGLPDTST